MADTPADALLALVPADGTQIGNQKLREQLTALQAEVVKTVLKQAEMLYATA